MVVTLLFIWIIALYVYLYWPAKTSEISSSLYFLVVGNRPPTLIKVAVIESPLHKRIGIQNHSSLKAGQGVLLRCYSKVDTTSVKISFVAVFIDKNFNINDHPVIGVAGHPIEVPKGTKHVLYCSLDDYAQIQTWQPGESIDLVKDDQCPIQDPRKEFATGESATNT